MNGDEIPRENSADLDLEAYAASMGIRDVRLVIGLYDAFFGGLQAQLNQIEKHTADGNHAELVSVAHSVKGASANLRLTGISALAERIEKLARAGEAPGEAVPEIMKLCGQVQNLYISKYK